MQKPGNGVTSGRHQTAETQKSRKQRLRTLRDLNRTPERFGTVSAEQEAEQQTLEVEDLAQQLLTLQRQVNTEGRHLRRYANIADALDDLIRIAESAAPQDPKLAAAIAQVEAIRAAEPHANILIDTEYTDSQAALVAALQAAGVGPVITMSGEDDEKTRATAERLLTGLVEEEASLFQREEPVFDLVSGAENSGADSATRELLEEIDRSLQGLERAATANTWLGADGLNACDALRESEVTTLGMFMIVPRMGR